MSDSRSVRQRLLSSSALTKLMKPAAIVFMYAAMAHSAALNGVDYWATSDRVAPNPKLVLRATYDPPAISEAMEWFRTVEATSAQTVISVSFLEE